MISSGLFILPGLVYLKIGPSAFLAYFLAGIFVIPSLLSKAELATAMPKAGGDYFFINRSMGAGFGTLAGISAWFSLSFKSAFALLGIGAFAGLIFPEMSIWQFKLIAVFFCIFFGITNIISTKHSGKLQNYLVLFLIGLLVLYIFRGLPEVKLDNFTPFFPGNYKLLFSAAGLIFISYGGLTKVASVAEEVKNPARNIPLGMILSFVVVTSIYVLVVFITVGVIGDNLINPDGSPNLTPISISAGSFMGKFGLVALSIAALLAFISTGNAGIMAASRSPMAMSRDKLIPSIFQTVHKKYKTPYISIIFTTLFMILVIVFLDLEMLVKTASTMKLLLFSFVNISVIIMRESGIQNYRPKFRSPLYPWIQIAAILIYIFLIIEMGMIPLIISGVFVATSLIWYWFYGRIRANRESALLYIIRRIGAKEITSFTLENELRTIIQERDEIQKDRFDHLIEICPVLDIKEKLNKNELFEIVAAELDKKMPNSNKYFYEKLIAREEESTTVLTENLAIPHIIIDGEKLFNIILIRCKKGIFFSEESSKIQTVFVIVGTRDERPFHLRSLAAIAQIIQNANFEKRWLTAKNLNALRDVIILGERKR
ncbi:MAG: amino acid permease [Candidatus Cloacimonetes bacterium]|nr:amino acid permease [Candidatus Cloacimonadota bacterium]